MKKILLVEDNGVMADNVADALNKYNVIKAQSFDSAMDRWEEANGDFSCIIVDLLIYPDGINGDENRYNPLFGMAFINEICKDNEDLRKKIIVYSGFSEELIRKSENADNTTNEVLWNIDGLNILSKAITSIDILINDVNKIVENE